MGHLRRFAVISLLTAWAFVSAAQAEPGEIRDRPPPLTFDEHVDYVGWYNEFVRRGRSQGQAWRCRSCVLAL